MTSDQIDAVRKRIADVRHDLYTSACQVDVVEELDAVLDELLEHWRDALTRELHHG